MIEVPGFLGCGISCGIKKNRKKDIGLIVSLHPAGASGVFTTNVVKAAPVILGLERIKGGKLQALVVNSGNANACTGKRGIEDAASTTRLVAKGLKIKESLVIPSSTGVIGVPLPMEKIKQAIPSLISGLSEVKLFDVAEAIMTTDSFPKYASQKVKIGRRVGTLCALGKGAGMIAPNMATMLCFILTDISIELSALKRALREVVDNSFNKIIVDGDTSTNDTVLILSNGVLGNETIRPHGRDYRRFKEALFNITTQIGEMIVKDGEGATKVVRVIVKGARTEKEAEKVARVIGTSLLVKTAFYGEDPNWGRIIAAAGRAGVGFDPMKVDLFFGNLRVVKNGVGVGMRNEKRASSIMKNSGFSVTLDLKEGKGRSFVVTSDTTVDYVKINAHYRT